MPATKSPKKTTKAKLNKAQLIEWFMEDTLENERFPVSVYKFSKAHNIQETDFYKFVGSFEGLREAIWHEFYQKSVDLMEKTPETDQFSNREKMLTFFFTFFEMLTANRSYVLMCLREHEDALKNLKQLKGLRRDVKNFAKQLIEADNEDKKIKALQRNERIFSEGAWVQTLFLLRFWMDDNSPEFEKTDMAIEKSVNTIFDVFDNTPFERIIDLGKFLYKEGMTK